MANLSERLGTLPVTTATGEQVELSSLWRARAAVLALVRHFGCQFCREQAAELREILPDIQHAAASLVVVGNGTPEELREFLETTGSGLTVYTDPSLRVYEALGARRGSARDLIDPKLILNGVRALRQGHRPGRVRGDRAQLGGVWVVRAGGEVVYEHTSEIAGDHPPIDEVRDALREAARVS